MSETTKSEFEQLLEDSFKNVHTGDIIEGKVLSVTPNEIAVNIGYKSDGIVTKNEYSNDASIDLTEAVKVGDTLSVKVLKLNDGDGQVVLSHKKVASEKISKVLEDAYNNHTVLKSKVTDVVKGGLVTVVDEVSVFIPASLASDVFTKNLNVFADQEIEFYMSEFVPAKHRYIGDCKTLLKERHDKEKEEALQRIQEGDIVEGTVKNVTSFGAFVDIGGIDGLLHISEMSWGRIDYPQNVYKKGDTVKVIVKKIEGEKVALSAKFDENNPWLDVADKFPVGATVKGKVARMTDFGAFVQLSEGVDALLHVSQISRKRIEKPADVLSVGDEIEAKIVDVNIADHKISLSMKELAPEEEEEETATEPANNEDAE